MSIAAAAYPNLSYHPTKTFIPLSMIANFPLILVVPPDHPAKNVKELVEWAKANPDKSNYASTSPAFTTASELLKLKSGMPGTDDPLQEQQRDDPERHAGPDPVCDLGRAAGHPADQGRQGEGAGGHRLGAVGRSCRTCRAWRKPAIPRSISSCSAATSPRSARRRRSSPSSKPALRKAIKDPDVSSKLKAMAVTPGGNSSADFRAMIDRTSRAISDVIKAANLKFEN